MAWWEQHAWGNPGKGGVPKVWKHETDLGLEGHWALARRPPSATCRPGAKVCLSWSSHKPVAP